jgi:hypothetical protein
MMIMVDGDDQKMIKCFTFGKEESKKNRLKAKVYMIGPFFVLHSRHHRGCE